MFVLSSRSLRADLRGGFEAAFQGASTLVTPSLLFAGLLGQLAAAPGMWGSLLAITLVPILRLLLGGSGSVLVAPRTASTATYVALLLGQEEMLPARAAVLTGSALSAETTSTQSRAERT